jgi:hypothetical protein
MLENATMSNSYEVKTLKAILSKYSFADFVSDEKKWLKNGRQSWYISGNLLETEAVDIVSSARESL